MRVLIAARYTLKQQRLGGVQSWIEAVQAHLEDVVTWGRGDPIPRGRFDLGILAHWCDTGHLADLCDRTASVSHGIIAPEAPGPADSVVFTSEEVRDHWKGTGEVIRQPIDLDFWSPAEAQRIYLTRFSYRLGLTFVPDIAQGLGLRYQHLRNGTPRQCRDILRQSACVIATGRAAVEAMACGAPVVIADHRMPYQGALLDPDTLGAMTRNYSGRGGIVPTLENMREAIQVAMRNGSLRHHAESYHDAETVAEQIIKAANLCQWSRDGDGYATECGSVQAQPFVSCPECDGSIVMPR